MISQDVALPVQVNPDTVMTTPYVRVSKAIAKVIPLEVLFNTNVDDALSSKIEF
jgi:hypothetical protein